MGHRRGQGYVISLRAGGLVDLMAESWTNPPTEA